MKYETYINNIIEKFKRHFDIETDVEILNTKIDIHARYYNISARTFITKHDVIDKCENYETCYIKHYKELTKKDLEKYCEFLKNAVEEFVNPDANHMSTYVTGVIVADSIDDDVREFVKNFKYSKAFMFYLKGWCDIRLVCIDLLNESVITNKAGKKVNKVYQPTP